MIVGYESTIEKFRERTAASAPYVLRRKACVCGKQVTAKQLVQHGRCAACMKVAVLATREAA